MTTKVCHFTSGHDNQDPRVFSKQCRTLVDAGFEVNLVTPLGIDELRDGVHIWGVGAEGYGRFKRMLLISRRVYKKAYSLDADIYHFHDPELIPYGLKLKSQGKIVIFDSHEDTPNDILDKHWIPTVLRPLVSLVYRWYEEFAAKRFDGVISVTPHIVDRFLSVNPNSCMITNYPIIEESESHISVSSNRENNLFCFIGRICEESNQINTLKALAKTPDVKYKIAGPSVSSYLSELEAMPNWSQVDYQGIMEFSKTLTFLDNAIAGFQLTGYIANFGGNIGSLGNTKMFNYMLSGLPIICTDFILWKEIIEENDCGLCVNPNNIDEISRAIRFIVDNPERARQMGENGRKMVLEKYNWESQKSKLIDFYKGLL